jgi:hypothetical protein
MGVGDHDLVDFVDAQPCALDEIAEVEERFAQGHAGVDDGDRRFGQQVAIDWADRERGRERSAEHAIGQ